MSHIVQIATKVRDVAAIAAACQRLQLPAPVQGTADLSSGEATGLLFAAPRLEIPDRDRHHEWEHPILTTTKEAGAIGKHLEKFQQIYAVELVRIEAQKKGHTVTETQLDDGSIRLQVQEGI